MAGRAERSCVALALCAAVWSFASLARADDTIRHPGDHPPYALELEPHGLVTPIDPPGNPNGSGAGVGMRLTIPVVKNGFIEKINNSVGVTFGLDWLHYQGSDVTVGPCETFVPGPAGTQICTRVRGPFGGPADYFYFPVAMQWNFWLHSQFSAFGELGLTLYYEKEKFDPDGHMGVAPLVLLGGRWHFSKIAALTFRLGYPAFSLGVSFLL